jgi:hypothetical protein
VSNLTLLSVPATTIATARTVSPESTARRIGTSAGPTPARMERPVSTRDQCYKTFYDRKLRLFVTS